MQHDSQTHVQDDGPLDDAERLMTSVQARLRRINTMSLWAARSGERAAVLQVELSQAHAELSLAQQEIAYWRSREARAAGLDPSQLPPSHYLEAVRTPQTEAYRAVAVQIDDEEWVVGLKRDRPTDVDPLREMRDWQQLVAAVRAIRSSTGDGA